MTQAITTRYVGPAAQLGTRVIATAAAGSIRLGWDHALNYEQNHVAAARKLAVNVGWSGTWVGGGLPKGGMVFVLADARADTFTIAPC